MKSISTSKKTLESPIPALPTEYCERGSRFSRRFGLARQAAHEAAHHPEQL